ncbi:MAG: L,D-transpeptidase family protein [Nitrospirae bacterium]|nr:L,D-transpeptidase family protein [Nitrospirota bacterium]
MKNQYRRTPVFSDKITYLVLNPYWHIPPKIAVQDKLPLIQKNPDYLEKEKIRVFQGWGAESKEIDPKSVNWSQVTEKSFPYRLRQEPGSHNALGRIKFMFPNKYNVYLHDTPSKELFLKTERTLSSGCIRIEKPIELAEYLYTIYK